MAFCLAFGLIDLFHLVAALYKSIVRLFLEYCSHIWAGANKCRLKLLTKIQKRVTRLVSQANLISSLARVDARYRVGSYSLFYRYYYGHCANSVAELMPWSAEIGRPLRNRSTDASLNFQWREHPRSRNICPALC